VTDKQPALFTFHKIREQCEQGGADQWRAFLEFYAPLLLHLLEIYGPSNRESAPIILKRTLLELVASDFERFRSTSRQSEREFLADIRALLLDLALESFAAQEADNSPTGVLDLNKVRGILENLPLLHQQMLFFKLAGYTDATLERMLRIAPRVAEKAFERLQDYAAIQRLDKDRCPWPADWLLILRLAHAAKTENCPPLHQLVRIQDGQVSWYDKEPVEKHAAGCAHCLESWVALCEVGYWRRAAAPVPAAQIEDFLRAIPLERPLAAKKSLLQRLFP
jgi:hypothetical protein